MPIDYDKWTRLAKEVEESENRKLVKTNALSKFVGLESESQREWSAMTPDERLAAIQRADEEDQFLELKHQQHKEYLSGIQQDVENADESWMYDVDPDSYEDFTLKRTWRLVKPRGADFFKAGDLVSAEQQWLGAVLLVQKVGLSWPTASELFVQLKCNLSQLYIKQDRWAEARRAATSALSVSPTCEKALYRRALTRIHGADWEQARLDLELLLVHHPQNADARRQLAEVAEALRRPERTGRRRVAAEGATPSPGPLAAPARAFELSNAIADLNDEGTLRKVGVMLLGREQLDGEALRWRWPWGREEWLSNSRQKAVLSVHVVVRSVGGEELFNTRGRLVLPETPQERDELRLRMTEVAALDDVAGKLARTPEDFVTREALQPLRWRYGDPCVYAGFDLAARSMELGEKALFEIDQPLLEPSVCEFYRSNGGAARVAGLPDFKHHIEDRKLKLLAEELPEWELDLESKVQRTVRVELELCALDLFEDLSPGRTGEYLLRVANAGRGRRKLVKGTKVEGNFVIAGALNGMALYRVERAVWTIGSEGQESFVNRHGQRTVWIPQCIGQIFRDACRLMPLLYEGTRLEARMQEGPAPMELNPKLAATLSAKRAWSHRPPVAIDVEFLNVLDF